MCRYNGTCTFCVRIDSAYNTTEFNIFDFHAVAFVRIAGVPEMEVGSGFSKSGKIESSLGSSGPPYNCEL